LTQPSGTEKIDKVYGESIKDQAHPDVTGTLAIVAYASQAVPSDRVEVCYAMIYPGATIVKIIIAQVLIATVAG
jgi:hypothetical protein